MHRGLLLFSSQMRLLPLRLLGLKAPFNVVIGRGIQWPLGNLRNIELGQNVSLGPRGWFHLPLDNRTCRIRIGDGTAVGRDFVISANNSITIGRNCSIGFRVAILDHDHVRGKGINPVTSGITSGEPVVIGDETFVGTGVVILHGVTIGRNCVINSNSVVIRSVEEGCVVSGPPAKVVMQL
jgi:acetyltransferase-like isoleucine patch superfamily enzyme